mmetsp:Transcript_2433/g.7584  ORF Transcript_2433/g.7584 Transcript_2433/m.7584 type:complete len:812 (-) Transcript_2433:82-2517(-)
MWTDASSGCTQTCRRDPSPSCSRSRGGKSAASAAARPRCCGRRRSTTGAASTRRPGSSEVTSSRRRSRWWRQPYGGCGRRLFTAARAGVCAQVEPLFDRLTVFDARLPHGVERAEACRGSRGSGTRGGGGWCCTVGSRSRPRSPRDLALRRRSRGDGLDWPLRRGRAAFRRPHRGGGGGRARRTARGPLRRDLPARRHGAARYAARGWRRRRRRRPPPPRGHARRRPEPAAPSAGPGARRASMRLLLALLLKSGSTAADDAVAAVTGRTTGTGTGGHAQALKRSPSSVLGTLADARSFFSHAPYDAHDSQPAEGMRAVTRQMLHAVHAVRGGQAGARLTRLFERLGDERNCCVRVLVIGGSNACGAGNVGGVFGRRHSNLGKPAGINGTWSAALIRYLNARSQRCCATGHTLDNQCINGMGTSGFNAQFAGLLGAKHKASPPHLVVVDTGANDFNSFVEDELKGRPTKAELQHGHVLDRRSQARLREIEVETEALARRILQLRPTTALLYVEDAWFNKLTSSQVLGAWNEHRPVLERLGVPACHSTLPLAALDERNRSHPLARPQVLVDVVHLSRWGHLLTAFFCVAVLHAEGEALWRQSAAQREARWRASLALPPLDPSIEGLVLERMTTPLALIDFTNSRGAGMEAVVHAEGWEWLAQHKRGDGAYIFDKVKRGASIYSTGGHKLGYVARRGGANFVANVTVETGSLTVGYLRSYSGAASVKVEVVRRVGDGTYLPLPASHQASEGSDSGATFHRKWAHNVSVHSSSVLRLRLPASGVTSGAPRAAVLIRFTLIEGNEVPFTLYSVQSC